ncbi:hypothetical protein, conserved [Eimeria brunetti]|uniref:LamG-like jellyroll fold domain-containing protein n=1 Tax=Eimeria brunetti TaxID=51314 RepID=U6LQ60_9EIME|nr:hypothetical protein, conserved [Eimeria brunetti]
MEVHLTFDESRPLDTSGKKNHGSGEVMAAAGIGGVGSSGLFRNNYVYVPSSESFKSADFSYTFFVYLLEDAKSRSINELHDQFCPVMHKGTMREDVQEASPALLVNPRDGRVKVVLGTTGSAAPGNEMQSNSRLRPHQWYHLGVVRHQNRMRLYVDGILDSSLVTEGATKTNDLPLFVGGAPYAENVCDMPMLLDEFRMFSYALGRDHIQAEASIALGGVEPSFLHIGCTNCNGRGVGYATRTTTQCILTCSETMALQTAVSAPTCGVKPVDILQSSEHGGMICNPDEECGKVPSEGRMRDFLSFLDQTASNPFYYGSQKPKKSDTPGDSTSNAALLSKISALEVELEDKEHNLKALHELRQREKLEEQRLRKQLQQQLEGDLTRTSEKYEQQCRKQQELLSQLQDEKKILASRYERLTEEMRELERRFAAKAAELHKQYGRELERQRRAFLSGEKARREAWARERAQEIKEITIKGLEPEIQRLINKHRAEKRCLEEKLRKIPDDMKKQLEEELAAQKAAVQRQMEEAFEVERIQHRQEIRTLKENYEAELGKEREAFAAKQKQQNAKWEAQITDGKNRIQGEIIKAREEEQLRLKEVTAQLLSEMEQQRNKHIRELQQTEAAAKAKEEEIIIQMSKDKETAVKEATEQTKKEVQEEAHK